MSLSWCSGAYPANAPIRNNENNTKLKTPEINKKTALTLNYRQKISVVSLIVNS